MGDNLFGDVRFEKLFPPLDPKLIHESYLFRVVGAFLCSFSSLLQPWMLECLVSNLIPEMRKEGNDRNCHQKFLEAGISMEFQRALGTLRTL